MQGDNIMTGSANLDVQSQIQIKKSVRTPTHTGVFKPAVALALAPLVGVLFLSLLPGSASDALISNWPIFFIALLSATVANATAVGGGFIFLPLFSIGYGLGAVEALKLALSTQAFGMTSGAGSWPRNYIHWDILAIACVGCAIGMGIGTFYLQPSPEVIHIYFGWTSIGMGVALMVELLLV